MNRSLIGILFVCLFPSLVWSQNSILMVDSGNDRIWQLNAFDGSLINNSFITNPGTFSTPKGIAVTAASHILVSDQISDSVYEFSPTGAFLGILAGPSNGLDNIRGITVRGNHFYVTVGGNTGGLNNTIQRFNLDGTGQVTWASTNMNSPFDILFRDNDALISNSGNHLIQQYDLTGSFLNTFHSGSIRFPQQMINDGTNVVVAGFSPPTGVYQYNASGVQVDFDAVNTGLRGIIRLGNGLLLWTGGTRYGTLDPTTGSVVDLGNITGANFQYLAAFAAVPEPATVALISAAVALPVAVVWRRRMKCKGAKYRRIAK